MNARLSLDILLLEPFLLLHSLGLLLEFPSCHSRTHTLLVACQVFFFPGLRIPLLGGVYPPVV